LTLHHGRPVANGLQTDHPIPGLPFVDDSHIPVEDPHAIEEIGRHPGTGMWGRQDPVRPGWGWRAFTTDPVQHDMAWLVRWHPEHGRSVVLYRDADASTMYEAYRGHALLFRAGGYWWDGTSWYRPSQIWDPAGEEYVRRAVPAALTITAADLLLDGVGDPGQATVTKIGDVDADAPRPLRWVDHLALWATRGQNRVPLAACVVNLSAPELVGDELVGLRGLAEIAGVATSTLRAYISRGEADVPQPQATVSGRNVWARTVAVEWAETRRTSPDSVAKALTGGRDVPAPGVAEVWNRFTQLFLSVLWENPMQRKRWALRWRTKDAAMDLARGLGWIAAADLGHIIPIEPLAVTVEHAVLDELAAGQRLARKVDGQDTEHDSYGIVPHVAMMLDWVIRHNPTFGRAAIANIIGEAERRFGIPRRVSAWSLRSALSLDSELEHGTLREFLDLVLTPAVAGEE
jgi:hypothetical protein